MSNGSQCQCVIAGAMKRQHIAMNTVYVDSAVIQIHYDGDGLCQGGNAAIAIVECHYADGCPCLYVNASW